MGRCHQAQKFIGEKIRLKLPLSRSKSEVFIPLCKARVRSYPE